MILIVQKAGIQKKIKNQDSKNEFISRMPGSSSMPGSQKIR
jgi:hypothetical protein